MKRWALLLIGVAILWGCQEQLTSPADCPTLCPSGQTTVYDTVIYPVFGRDSTFPGPNEGGPAEGYVARGRGTAVLVSNGLPDADARAVFRFSNRPDSLVVQDTARAYTVDSAAILLPLLGRDSTVHGTALQLYLMNDTLADSTVTLDEVNQAIAAGVLASVPIPDTSSTGVIRYVFRGAELDRIRNVGTMALAVGLSASQPTGVRLATPFNATSAQFVSYLHIEIPDTTLQLRIDSRPLLFATWVTPTAPTLPDPEFLAVGGSPSRRALIRFDFPAFLRDSATVLRATLELTPTGPIPGLPNDPAVLGAQGVLSDLGAKSPLVSTATVTAGLDTIFAGQSTPAEMDVGSLVRLWRSFPKLPTAIFVSLSPEGSSFMRPLFYGTRSEPGGPPITGSVQPRLRITYILPFNFQGR
ncbi:MAG TPA: hypothetical protein VFL95_04385 [Gemmatimonadales bacterium]|nr:hypothetical protein [Gemmatimonadales bacterium]